MKLGRSTSLLNELQKLLSNGPLEHDTLVEELDRRGLRGVTDGELFLLCAEHPVARFEQRSRSWVPAGTPTEVEDERPSTRVTIGKSLSHAARSEVAELRGNAGLPVDAVQVPRFPVDPRWDEVVRQALRALADEHAEAVRQVAEQQVHLENGRRHSATEGRDLIVYQMQDDVQIREGSQATLVVGDESGTRTFDVDIVSRFGLELTLSVPHELPPAKNARLRIDLTWLISKQRARFANLLSQPERFNSTAALAVVTPQRGDSPRLLARHRTESTLNTLQNEAVRHGMSSGLTWLWGPPGTGKTTTLSVLIRDLLGAGKRVLLSAPTNTAVDVALGGALRRIDHVSPGDVVRVGQPVDETLANRETPVLADEIAARRGEEIARRLVSLREEQSKLTADLKLAEKNKARGSAGGSARLATQLRLTEIKEMITQLNSTLSDVRRQIVREARLVAATAHQCTLDLLDDQRFDVVVIDEASMLPSALAMLVAGLGSGHTVVAGDFRQLGPVAVSDSPSSHKWLHDSPFEASQVAAQVLRNQPPPNLVALTTQHRMRGKISDAVSSGFYSESPLRTATSVTSRARPSLSCGPAEVVAVDTSGLHTWVGRRGGISSRFNLMHAQIGAAIAAASAEVDSAFITPFNCQASLLRPFTADVEHGEASTVHKFQGGEADLVVFDCVDAPGSNFNLHNWFASGQAGSDGARLINVAASRAREQLVVIADFDRIHRGRGTVDATYKFMRQFLNEADRTDWRQLVTHWASPTSVHTDVNQLAIDIENANGPVEIRTASVSSAVLMPLLKTLRATARRVPVSIWFRPEPNGDLPSPLTHLTQSDVLLRPAQPLHESMAIVGSVVWSSSRPLLSDISSTWLRTQHAGLADATRMVVRRRSTGSAQGSDQAADRCACGRPLVRVEEFQRGPEMECLYCERDSKGARKRQRKIR